MTGDSDRPPLFYTVPQSIMEAGSEAAIAVLGGLIVTESSTGALQHFDTVGYMLVATTLITLVMMYFISRRVAAAVTLPSVAPTPAPT